MVTGSRTGDITAVGTDEKTRKMILSIKEIVGNHSDADILAVLKETNMDADEAVQKLIYQDPFHEVKRKKDKKKEETKVVEPAEKRNSFENPSREVTSGTQAGHNVSRGTYNHNKLPRNAAPRNAFPKNPAAGPSRKFRVVSDNRSKLNANKELKNTSVRLSGPSTSGEAVIQNERGSSGGSRDHQTYGAHISNAPADSRSRQTVNVSLRHSTRTELSEGRQTVLEVTLPSGNSVLGVYSSSADPVHVPSPYSRSSAIGAIRREAMGVGFGRKPSENVVKDSSAVGSMASLIRKDGSPKSHRSFLRISKIDHGSRTKARETAIPNHRSLLNSQHGNRHHQYIRTKQQADGLSKGSQNKRWKPKSNQKSSRNNAGVTETSENSRPVDDSGNLESEIVKLQDNLSLVSITESQNVIIADRIRVPEINRCQLTFGSFVLDVDLPKNSASGLEEAYSSQELKCGDPDDSLPTSPPQASTNGSSSTTTAIMFHSEVRTSGAGSPPPVLLAAEQLFSEQKEAPNSQNLDKYAQTELNSSSAALEQKQQQVPFQLHNFPDYNPQEGYDLPVFRQVTDDNVRVQEQGRPSLPEQSVNPHMFNNVPASSIPMLEQQHAPMTQMYPQVHVSHLPNGMPYHQFLSPVYVPQMPMQGYTGNPAAYTHPTNANSYVVMPGGSSHPNASGLKIGIQPFKQVPAGAPASFGTFNNPNGYQISSLNAPVFEDSYRLKFKDRNVYVPNPQAENSEIWMQNPRDLSGLQSPYYNMAGQTPHGAYLSSFNSPPVQASHMQFQGVFHSQQPDPMANPHHMGLGLDGNAGLRVAPSPSPVQVGAYQQPQLGHINWPANF